MLLLPRYKGFKQERIIGEHTVLLPDPPSLSHVAYRDMPQEKQKFYRAGLPKNFNTWDVQSKNTFIDTEWDRRLNGFWFMNNGVLEYITGTHYFYVGWWRIDIGYPNYIDSDRDFYYVWKHCEDDPKCTGLIYITDRRSGKTYKATSILYEATSRTPDSQSGIQSKNDKDAKKVFNKLILSWQRLPDFFKPVDAGESRPGSRLEFIEPRTRNSKSQVKEYTSVLNSWIDYESAQEEAYDGQKQLRYFADEIGKTVEVNVDDRQKTVRECLMDGSAVIGKSILTTTVEEMEKKGGKNCKSVWDKSSIKEKDDNGFTKSGLYRLFKPAFMGYRGKDIDGVPFVDEYGNSNQEKAKAYFERKRKALKGADLSSEKRKYPLEERDCWVSDSRKSVYDTLRIEQQLEHNQSLPNAPVVRGNFLWKDGVRDSVVEWHPNPAGKWLVAWLPKIEDRNKWTVVYGQKSPDNKESGCLGLDPYDNKATSDNRKSDAASYGYRKFDPLQPLQSGMFVSEYVNRPALPEIMWEDMILQAVFYGWEILIESNKIGTINHFRQRGYYNYLMDRPDETHTDYSKANQKEKGIPMTSEEARMSLVYATESYIAGKIGLIEEEGKAPYYGTCYFDGLLEDWRKFDLTDKWTSYDRMVGAGLALIGSRKIIPKKEERKPFQLFKVYNNSGMTSTEVKPNWLK